MFAHLQFMPWRTLLHGGKKIIKKNKMGYLRYLLNLLCSHAARHCCPRSAWFKVKCHWPLSGDPRHKCAELPSWNWKCCPCFGWASAGCPGVAGVATSGKWWHPRPVSRGSTSPAPSVPPVDTSTYTGLIWLTHQYKANGYSNKYYDWDKVYSGYYSNNQAHEMLVLK